MEYNRYTFWNEITGQRSGFYEARSVKESQIQLPALRYLHRLMAYSLFFRKNGDTIVTTTELNILYYIYNNEKLDVCHTIALKLKDVTTKMARAIKIGRLVTNIAYYIGFDVDNMPFKKLMGHTLIDISIMEAIGMVTRDHHRNPHLINTP